jgi:hypothetical protein
LWVHRKSVGARLEILDIDERYQSIKDALSLQDWQRLWIRLTGKGNGGIDAHWIPDTLTRVAQACFREAPKVRFVPAIREISDQGDVFDDFSGKGLIEELARHQNPSFSERELHKKFEKINQFLRSVVRSGDARIEIPHNLESILVHIAGDWCA